MKWVKQEIMFEQNFTNERTLRQAASQFGGGQFPTEPGKKKPSEDIFEQFARDIEDATFEVIDAADGAPNAPSMQEKAPNERFSSTPKRDFFEPYHTTEPDAAAQRGKISNEYSNLFRQQGQNKSIWSNIAGNIAMVCVTVMLALPLVWLLSEDQHNKTMTPDYDLRTASIEAAQPLQMSEEVLAHFNERLNEKLKADQNSQAEPKWVREQPHPIERASGAQTIIRIEKPVAQSDPEKGSIVYFYSDLQ